MKIKYEEYLALDRSIDFMAENDPAEITAAILLLCKILLTFQEIEPGIGSEEKEPID